MRRYDMLVKENKAWIDSLWEKFENKLSKTTIKSRDKIPYSIVEGNHDNQADDANITWWTNGFWGGLNALAYAQTKMNSYLLTAKRSEELLDACFDKTDKLDHDVGFLWHILSGAIYRLTGDSESKKRNLFMADFLKNRFNEKGGFIRCWNGEEKRAWTIIDCMMNLSLLYWASEETGDPSYKQVAIRHADMTMNDHIRKDGSVVHIVEHELDKVGVVSHYGGQGYDKNSSWSRGTAWAVYGFVLSYLHTGEKRYLDTAEKVADYFIESIKKTDYLPLADFKAPPTPIVYDASAGVIAACGLIELAKATNKENYLISAIHILKKLEKDCCDFSENDDSILQQCSGSYYHCRHIHLIYGDYFLAEALLKLKGLNFLPW